MSICRHQSVLLGISMLLGTSSCQMTMTELKALNPSAATLVVPCRPSQIPDNVKVMAFRSESGHIVTDEDQNELLNFAPLATVFIEFNDAAPPDRLGIMAADYGLLCPDDRTRQNARYFGQTVNTSASSGATSLPRIGVCARPPGITDNQWYGGPGIKGTSTNAAEHAKEIAKATVLFYLDPKAPPESVWHFGKNTKVRCPGNAPIPYDQWVAQNMGTSSQQSSSTNSAPSSASTTTTTTPKKGDEKTTETSGRGGQGPPLSTFEAISRNLALAGALSQMDTSGDPKDPKGSRSGIPGGKNVGGFSFPLLQAGVATLQILTSAGLSPKKFIDDIVQFAKRGQRTLIKEADAKMMQVADDLIKDAGQYEMAKGLQEMQTIMPFELGQKFTANLGGKFQAHKIVEKRALELFYKDGALKEAVKKAPAIILTDEEHKVVSKALNEAWKKYQKANMTKADLRKIYEEVYRKDYPQWLDAIDSYLR